MAIVFCKEHRFETIEAVLFDKDGTLASVEPYLLALGSARVDAVEHLVPNVRADILKASGLRDGRQGAVGIDPAGLMAVGSRVENEIAAAAYIAAKGIGWVQALAIVKGAFDRATERLPEKVSQTPLLEGAIALIARLRANKISVGIVSSDTHAEVAAFVEHYALAVNWYCGAGGFGRFKTQAGFLDFACREMGAMPSNTLVIGDSASDVALSNQGAAGFIGMTGGWSVPPTFENSAATVSHLSQVQTSTE